MVTVKKSKDRGYSLPPGMSEAEAQLLDKLLQDKVKATPGRKRPRNPNEAKALARWSKGKGKGEANESGSNKRND